MLDPEWSRRGFLGLGVSAGFLPARLMASTAMEWSNGVLVLPDGSTATGGLRMRNGIIEAVGPSVTGGIDLDGAWIVPGFTDAGCRLGLVEVGMEADTHDASTKENQAPDARAVDGYNPRSELIPVARVNGITSILLNPESTGMIPGQAALMRTVGDRLGDVVLAAPAGLCMNVGRAAQAHDGPKSRIGVMQKSMPRETASETRRATRARAASRRSRGSCARVSCWRLFVPTVPMTSSAPLT
jgi:imidazolonepropionase-like amidohydrolase